MDFFLDTGLIEDIKKAKEMGLLDGVTTNPSLIAKTGRPREEVIEEICRLTDGPVSAEVLSTDVKGMMSEAQALREIADNVVIKLPMTPEGVEVCGKLTDMEIPTNVTLVFSPAQALLAAKQGATFVSPFIGRLDDIGHDGMQLVREIRQIFENYNFNTEILAASIRHPFHVRDAALAGAHVSTMPLSALLGLFKHPLTESGLATFLKDAGKA